jgi:DNA-binding MarR family transcriptional regulator
MWQMNDWTDELHHMLLSISGAMNDPNVDAEFLLRAGIALDRALFPLLSWIGESGPMGIVELANMVGRDHSTVSRQVARLVDAKLVAKVATPDKRMRLLLPTAEGRALVAKIKKTRRTVIQHHFRLWSVEERGLLLTLLKKALEEMHTLFPSTDHAIAATLQSNGDSITGRVARGRRTKEVGFRRHD